ncbi:MAG: hypothetical protein JF612_14090, partial [Planctomycetia bacterium]|nr:hypothetical protein [Planctomycetia bacterium]
MGATRANGVFTVEVTDANHFALVGANSSGGAYTSGGTWSKLVETTRDPIMRVVLPNAANGTALKNSPWFLRVRSQPATFAGEFGNNLNPGLTSGQYQLQVRLQQATEKPASTVRFADIRFATTGIEVHGLPYHSPLGGETAESDTANGSSGNDAQSSAQFLGNVLTTDKNTITVGGQIANINDVDWYQFDLNADLTTIYGSGFNNGNQGSDQATTGSDLSRGSFGQLDPFIGSVQLPAGKIGTSATRTYYVAVSTDRQIPTTLNQQFLSTPSDSLVRLEPIDSIGRIVQDTVDQASGQTAQLAQNQYVDPTTGLIKSSIFDTTNKQTLSANIVPFNLSDVSMFVSMRNNSNQSILELANPATGVVDISRIGTLDAGPLSADDLAMRGDGTLWDYESDFTAGNTSHAGNINQVDPATAVQTQLGQDNIATPTGAAPTPVTIQYVNMLVSGRASALAWGGNSINPIANSTQEPLYLAVDNFATGASALYFANFNNGNAFVTQNQPW